MFWWLQYPIPVATREDFLTLQILLGASEQVLLRNFLKKENPLKMCFFFLD